MKFHHPVLFVLLLVVSACSPSMERIQTILDAYISASEGDSSTVLLEVEQMDKGVYSGRYGVGKDDLILFVYPFTAIVKKDQVTRFFKDTDDDKVAVVTFLTDGQGQYHSDETGLDYIVETKAAYEERLRKEEEERARLAAQRSALSGSDLGQKGANYLLSGSNNIIQVISYHQAAFDDALNKVFFGQNSVTYVYKVLEATGFGTNTNEYDVVFRDGNVVHAQEHKTGIDDTMGSVASSLSYLELLKGMQ